MLGIIKLGAVIMPMTTAVGLADLRDRIDRGAAGFVIANAEDTLGSSRTSRTTAVSR